VVALSSEVPVPDEVEVVDIEVKRGAKRTFFQRYDLEAGTRIPGTLTLKPLSSEDTSAPIVVTVRAWSEGKEILLRKASTTFVEEKQKLLRMPLRYSCYEFPEVCGEGKTCKGGSCVDQGVPSQTLPDVVEEQGAGQATCFDDQDSGCMLGRTDVTFTAEQLKAGNCEIDLAKANPDPSKPIDPGSLNLMALWSQARDQGHPTVLDLDLAEGWSFVGESKTLVRLADGLCKAVQNGKIRKVQFKAGGCPSKLPTTPLCERARVTPVPLRQDSCSRCVYSLDEGSVCFAQSKALEDEKTSSGSGKAMACALACPYDGKLDTPDECDAIDQCVARCFEPFTRCSGAGCDAFKALDTWSACLAQQPDWRVRCPSACAETRKVCVR